MESIKTEINLTKGEVLEVYAESTEAKVIITYDGNKVFVNGSNISININED